MHPDLLCLLAQYSTGPDESERRFALAMLLMELIEWCEIMDIDFEELAAHCCDVRAAELKRDAAIAALVVTE